METWTNEQWGALIGALVVLLVITIGAGATALVVLGCVVGYFVGGFTFTKYATESPVRGSGRQGEVLVPRYVRGSYKVRNHKGCRLYFHALR